MSTLTAPDVYARQLFRLGFGYPLWDPEPPRGEVFVGDIGFVGHDGSFHRVFNATLQETDPNNTFGVPAGYKPFSLTSEFQNDNRPGALAPGALCSKTIKQISARVAATTHGVGAGFDFECTDEQGAVLVIQRGANREAIHPSRRMVNYMSQNFSSWHEFITGRLDVDISREDIRFISGVYKTADWAVASYTEAGRSAQFRFNADFPVGSVAFSASASAMSQTPPLQNWGPRSNVSESPRSSTTSLRGAKNDQSVFIHYYKLKKRLFVFPRVMKAAAGYDELPPGPDDGTDEDRMAIDGASGGEEVHEFELDQPGFQCWDPVDFVLDYILEHASNCQIAVANDRDINQLCEKHGCEIPEDLPSFLETIKPTIEVTEDGLGMLSHDDLASLNPSHGTESAPSPIGADKATDAGVPPTGVVQTEDQAHETSQPSDTSDHGTLGGSTNNNGGHDAVHHKKARYLGPNGGIIEFEHHAGGVTSLAYSPDGRHIASGADDALVNIWDAESGRCAHKCHYHSETVCALAFSPDGKKLVSGSGDCLAVIWDVETGRDVAILTGHLSTVYCVAYSPDGAIIATGSVDASVKIWDAASGHERWSLSGHSAIVLIVAFSPDSRRLVSASADYTTRVWDPSNGNTLWVLEGHQGVIYSLAYAPDNRRLVTGSDDGSARIWNTETGEELVDLRVHSGSVWSATFSPDGKELLSAASDGSIRICDSYSGEKLHEIEANDQLVNATAFSADGSRICASSADNSIRVWDATTAKQLTTLDGHSDKVSHLRFSPDGTRIVSSSDDGMLRIWNLNLLGVGQAEEELVEE